MKIFIDGSSGTTGLNIYQRLEKRSDITLIKLSESERKDESARKQALWEAEAAFLCLPDDAAKQAVLLAQGSDTVIFDTSTAHRTQSGWAYGFPELGESFEKGIRNGRYIAVPGCHASGFIALVYPLLQSGLIAPEQVLSCFSLTGYSGGGKKMIAQYQTEPAEPALKAPRHYGLGQQHKHLKEMKKMTGLLNEPIFCPVVDDFYSGMLVSVPIFASQLQKGGLKEVQDCYRSRYTGKIVQYVENADDGGFLCAGKLSGTDSMQITVCGNEERMVLTALYDNLGKGACGAAIECLNLVSGKEADFGLVLAGKEEK